MFLKSQSWELQYNSKNRLDYDDHRHKFVVKKVSKLVGDLVNTHCRVFHYPKTVQACRAISRSYLICSSSYRIAEDRMKQFCEKIVS